MAGILPALRNPNFAIYAASTSFCYVALWIQRTAMGWLIWEMTESSFWLGLLSFAYLIPVVLIGPIGGVLADRVSNLRILIVSQTVMATISLVVAAWVITGQITPLALIFLTCVQGTVEAFSQTAQLSLVPAVARGPHLPSAIAVTSMSFNSSRFVGPAIAGLLIVGLGVPAAFTASALGFLTFLAGLIVLSRKIGPMPSTAEGSFLNALREGLRYAAGHPTIGPLMVLMVLVGVLGRQAMEMLPGFAEGIYQSGAFGLSVLTSSAGAGAIVSGLFLNMDGWSRRQALGNIAVLVYILGMATIVLTFLPSLWMAALAVATMGYLTARAGIMMQTLINLVSRDNMRGRVLSYYGVIFRGGPAIGALIAGVLAEWTGLANAILIGAAALIASTALWHWRLGAKIPAGAAEGAMRPEETPGE